MQCGWDIHYAEYGYHNGISNGTYRVVSDKVDHLLNIAGHECDTDINDSWAHLAQEAEEAIAEDDTESGNNSRPTNEESPNWGQNKNESGLENVSGMGAGSGIERGSELRCGDEFC